MSGSTASGAQSSATQSLLDNLVKVLIAEHNDGCRDRIVIGGLDRFLANWLRTAGDQSSAADLSKLAALATDRVRNYAQKPAGERARAIQQSLKSLEQARRDLQGETKHKPVKRETGQSRRSQSTKPVPDLKSPVTTVRGVNTALASKLQRLGVHTIEDLIYLFPHRYDDYSNLKRISELRYGEDATITGIVWEAQNHRTPRGKQLTKAIVSDDTGTMETTWFNQPYLVRQLLPGRRIVLSGRVDEYLGRLTFQSPAWEPWADDLTHTGRLVPVYPLTQGLTARRMRTFMKTAVEQWAPTARDCLPPELRKSHNLMEVTPALCQMHFPDDKAALERARRRLCFEELLCVQLGVLRQRRAWQQLPGRPMAIDQSMLDAFLDSLPFTLTPAQKRVLGDIIADLRQSSPMSRLLQGEVGSGKTVVALTAMLVAVANGMQAVIMAPTEILAEQHYRTIQALLREAAGKVSNSGGAMSELVSRTRVGLLLGALSQAEKQERRSDIAAGKTQIVIGTHALIQESVTFKDLGLAVIDEQHRFGVAQRTALRQKGYNPHLLVMSATPIPRTLALTIYGDLDISVIDQLPPHRQRIMTKWLAPSDRERAYAFVRDQVSKERQAFIVCPLIEESEKIETKAATSEYRYLQDEVFLDLRLGLLHGRMKSTDKDQVMERFRGGELDILVTTSVVEVGIDVPNATVMLVEGADRFGLAQLHQFRGRVGRGEHQSYCLLLAESPSFGGEQRLKVIETTDDGFLLAEEDLKMRGPGEFFGTRQSGLPDLKVAGLGDTRVLEEARRAAVDLFREDPTMAQPHHQALAERVRAFWGAKADLS